MIIYDPYKNLHARICMFTVQGLGRKEHIILYLHTVKSTIY